MLESILDYLKQMVKSKLFPMVLVFSILFGILVGRMFFLQILHGDEYNKIASVRTNKVREIKSARGKIFDCNGKLLASNVQSYTITIEDTGEINDPVMLNDMIYRCLKIIKSNGDKPILDFPISIDKKGKVKFISKEKTIERFKKDIYYCTANDELSKEQKAATAKEVFEYLRSDKEPAQFCVGSKYSAEEALEIMAVRYAMLLNTYKKYIPVTVSNNVSQKTIAAIKENSASMPGVEVVEELKREYYDSEYFAHIIGYTGLISSETLAQYQDENPNTPYSSTDQIGKTGIEKEYENVLKGKKGSETLVIDDSYRVTETKDQKSPVVGNDIYLTIDADLQKAYYKILEKKIAGILLSKLNNSTDAGTRGESAKNIRVPIYDVYNAIIQNNVVDVDKFSDEDASKLEKRVYHTFQSSKKQTKSKVRRELSISNKQHGNQISENMQDCLDYIFKYLVSRGMIINENIDKSDKTYVQYLNEKVSMSQFLQYAISKNWISLQLLDIGKDYYSTEEIYEKLVDYIIDNISEDVEFDKLVYHDLIYNFDISGHEVCLLLYEQGILSKKSKDYTALKAGSMDAYSFIRKKIKQLEITPGQLGLDPCSGALIVTDVNTGKVKAMVSYPSYDNNKFANSVDSEYFAQINSNKASPLLNRATQQSKAPGSTYKMVTSATCLEEGIITPSSTVHDNTKFTKITKPHPTCWSSTSHGTINVSQAIKDSCNYFFYEMGYRLGDGHKENVNNEKGLKRLAKYAKMFGLDKTSGVELTESTPTLSYEDTVRSAIGQGKNSFAPIQLSRYVTTLANRGTCYDLTIIDKLDNISTHKVKKNKAKIHNTCDFAGSTWDAISTGMKNVVAQGSIKNLFRSLPVTVAGKTGTAQENDNKPNHALFVSYAPYEDPEISVTSVIANGYASSNAAELASDVYMYYYNKKARKRMLRRKVTGPRMESRAFAD